MLRIKAEELLNSFSNNLECGEGEFFAYQIAKKMYFEQLLESNAYAFYVVRY